MVLRERVAIADVGIFHAVKEHVHAADAEHGVVEVEPVKQVVMEVFTELRIPQRRTMVSSQILACRDEKPCGAARRVAEHIRRLRSDEFDHRFDDVPRRAKLAVLPRRGDLPEHVFVEVALRIPILHRHVVDQVHDL